MAHGTPSYAALASCDYFPILWPTLLSFLLSPLLLVSAAIILRLMNFL
jgi:hypothetical protein